MYYSSRKFITGNEKESFLAGARLGLSKLLAKKVELVRLSVKKVGHIYEIHSLWGRKGRAVGHLSTFMLDGDGPRTPEELAEHDWKEIGEIVGQELVNWADNDVEFDRSEVKAQAIQYDVWSTSQWTDVAQDMLEEVEFAYGLHLGGKLHWRVRKALTDRIAAFAAQLQQDNISNIDTATRSKVLKNTVKKEIASVNS